MSNTNRTMPTRLLRVAAERKKNREDMDTIPVPPDFVDASIERGSLPRFQLDFQNSFSATVLSRDEEQQASAETEWLEVYLLRAEEETICALDDELIIVKPGEIFTVLELDLADFVGRIVNVKIDANLKRTIIAERVARD